jgi:hypothetical protein
MAHNKYASQINKRFIGAISPLLLPQSLMTMKINGLSGIEPGVLIISREILMGRPNDAHSK